MRKNNVHFPHQRNKRTNKKIEAREIYENNLVDNKITV